jgi:hypothetical protein
VRNNLPPSFDELLLRTCFGMSRPSHALVYCRRHERPAGEPGSYTLTSLAPKL